MSKQAFKAYQKTSISTSDPTKIIVMLYEGTIRNLRQSIDYFEAGQKQEASDRITRALDIVHYLYNSLDFEQGGEIAENLAKLYDFVRDTLALANINADVDRIETSIEILKPLMEGWQGVVEKNSARIRDEARIASDAAPSISVVG